MINSKITSFLVISFVICMMILSLAACDNDSDKSSSDDSEWKVKKDSRLIAEEFLLNSDTFRFDGIQESVEQALAPEAAGPGKWRFQFSFISENEGYGDRSGEELIANQTYHEALITIDDGEVVKAVIDNDWDMLEQKRSEDWTWGDAGKQAVYGIVSVFAILILLTILTKLAGSIIMRMERQSTADKE